MPKTKSMNLFSALKKEKNRSKEIEKNNRADEALRRFVNLTFTQPPFLLFPA
jgi:hypothetical protein